jgi:hypothetical protein
MLKRFVDYRWAKDYSWLKVRIPKFIRLDAEYRPPATWEIDGTLFGYKIALSGEPKKV